MQKDLDLLAEVKKGCSRPVLRLYRWSKPAVSIGYFQSAEEVVNWQACQKLGLDLVKRPTGGRLVIHDQELTYSFIVPGEHPFIKNGGVLEVYRQISQGLVEAFGLLGIAAELAKEPAVRSGLSPGSCFDTPSDYEIQVQGKKVVGSAQVRRGGVVLQHGSILFRLNAELYAAALRKAANPGQQKEPPKLSEVAAGLLDLGYRLSYEEMTQALIEAFSALIPADFKQS